MHEGVWLTVLGLFGLMTISVLVLPLSRKSKCLTLFYSLAGDNNWIGGQLVRNISI